MLPTAADAGRVLAAFSEGDCGIVGMDVLGSSERVDAAIGIGGGLSGFAAAISSFLISASNLPTSGRVKYSPLWICLTLRLRSGRMTQAFIRGRARFISRGTALDTRPLRVGTVFIRYPQVVNFGRTLWGGPRGK